PRPRSPSPDRSPPLQKRRKLSTAAPPSQPQTTNLRPISPAPLPGSTLPEPDPPHTVKKKRKSAPIRTSPVQDLERHPTVALAPGSTPLERSQSTHSTTLQELEAGNEEIETKKERSLKVKRDREQDRVDGVSDSAEAGRPPVASTSTAKDPLTSKTPLRKRPKATESLPKLPTSSGVKVTPAVARDATKRPPVAKAAPGQPMSGVGFLTGLLGLGSNSSTLKVQPKKDKPARPLESTRTPETAPAPVAAPMTHEERMRELQRRREEERQALESATKTSFDLLEQSDVMVEFETDDLRPAIQKLCADTAREEDVSVVCSLPRLTTFGSVFSLFPRSELPPEVAPQ
ncbi:hypothetical protein P7C70_g8215, partial [Phenoliferia sp. Uapishka_3]